MPLQNLRSPAPVGGYSSMVEPQIVVLDVAGSSPVGHPISSFQRVRSVLLLCLAMVLSLTSCATVGPRMNNGLSNFTLDYDTPVDPELQGKIESIDAELRSKYGMSAAQTAVGVFDLKRLRLAVIHPDRIEYAASVAKIGILLAWFH